MRIQSVEIGKIRIPLVSPYVSALGQVSAIEDIVVIIRTQNGMLGYGSAAATPMLTGDTQESIVSAIVNVIAPNIIGRDMSEFDQLSNFVYGVIEKNNSAKAAVDIALHDLQAKRCNLPLYQFLGGGVAQVKTGITLGLKSIEEMVFEAKKLVSCGFTHLKIKAGVKQHEDIARITAIRKAVGADIELSIDANQAWNVKQALKIINQLEVLNLDIAVFEQPVSAHDLEGLRFIRERTNSLIFADESCFSPRDALHIIGNNFADGIAIKLMKSGGIYAANMIYAMANSHNIPCMAGCMLESPIGITAITSFTSGKKIDFVDLGTLSRIEHNPVIGGAKLKGATLMLADKPGLGIDYLEDFEVLHRVG